MRISEGILWGFCVVWIMAGECDGLARDYNEVRDAEGFRNSSLSSESEGSGRTLRRKRRFIAFPVGSSFSVAVCMTVGVLGNPNWQYLSLGLNWGLAYNLPNSTWVLEHAHGFGKKAQMPEPMVKRRYRRELYQRLELIMNQ